MKSARGRGSGGLGLPLQEKGDGAVGRQVWLSEGSWAGLESGSPAMGWGVGVPLYPLPKHSLASGPSSTWQQEGPGTVPTSPLIPDGS